MKGTANIQQTVIKHQTIPIPFNLIFAGSRPHLPNMTAKHCDLKRYVRTMSREKPWHLSGYRRNPNKDLRFCRRERQRGIYPVSENNPPTRECRPLRLIKRYSLIFPFWGKCRISLRKRSGFFQGVKNGACLLATPYTTSHNPQIARRLSPGHLKKKADPLPLNSLSLEATSRTHL